MQVLGDLLKNVVTIIVVTTFLDMLLPSGALRSFVKAIAGLFVILAMINPIMSVAFKNEGFEVFIGQQGKNMPAFADVTGESESMKVLNEQLIMDNYQMRIEAEVEELVETVEGVKEAEVQVDLAKGRGKDEKVPVIGEVKVKVKIVETETEGFGNEPVIREVSDVDGIQPVKIHIDRVKADNSKERRLFNEAKPGGEGNIAGAKEEKRIEKEIDAALCRHFGLKREQIQVVF